METVKKTRKEQAQETKQRLFDVAFQMLSSKPFEEIKIRDIVEAAGVSIGTFYLYYKTKLDVFYETYVIADSYFDTTVRANLSKVKTTPEKIRKYFKAYAEYSSDITSLALTKVLYNSENKKFNRDTENGMHSLLLEIVTDGIKNGEIKSKDNAKDISKFLLIAARGQVYDWCTMDGSYSLEKAMDAMISKLLNIYL